jgi:hypothetical protein
VLVTSPRAPTGPLRPGQWFLALYAPPSLSAKRLGRGSFLKGQ